MAEDKDPWISNKIDSQQFWIRFCETTAPSSRTHGEWREISEEADRASWGTMGKIGIERQYRDAEQALYHLNQHSDESNDSFLARADVAWSKLLSQKLSLEDLQAFILLRGSNLTPDEKKRVILEAEQQPWG